MDEPAYEVNFDGIVGPTHHYGGLSTGNLASQRHAHHVSHPRAAALEGLDKMRRVASMGVKQAVLPPHPRPHWQALRSLGFAGDQAQVLSAAYHHAPDLLAACSSASAMWAANAATVSPAPDTRDARLHLTPANLISTFHRSLEPRTTATILNAIFPEPTQFAHHPPLPCALRFRDEGAANHMRLAPTHDRPGVEVFVYSDAKGGSFHGRGGGAKGEGGYPARQTLDASRAIARSHALNRDRTLFVRQNPAAIEAGVFHNDVIALSNQYVLLYHERAFAEHGEVDRMRRAYRRSCGEQLVTIEVPDAQVSLQEAVHTYLFNSQLLTLPEGPMALVCPVECREHPGVRAYLEQLRAAPSNPIHLLEYVDVRQSMHNGGGPACLRVRAVLSETQLAAAHPHVFWTPRLDQQLRRWVNTHYREQLRFEDLADLDLAHEAHQALRALEDILQLSLG